MNFFRLPLILALCTLSLISTSFAQEPQPIFDGKSLNGWKLGKDAKAFWKVSDGTLIGTSNGSTMPLDSVLTFDKEYEHFEFSCQFKTSTDFKAEALLGGIQFRAQKDGPGYRADFGGPNGWGGISDLGKRGSLAKANMKNLLPALKQADWNEITIHANGPRVRVSINGIETANFLENKPAIPYLGHLALSLSKGAKGQIEFKNIRLTKLDGGLDPADNKAWWAAKARVTYQELQISNIPQTAEKEQTSFELADGFVAELVAQESEGIGKFVAVDFDHRGRMWSMTALDYPVDANKEKTKAQNLFKNGGKDKLLVFDTPTQVGEQKPRIFATNLAIPLSVMPYGNGAIAQYGPDIRHYQDTNGDDKADKFEVLLTGFGIQDSHLFPHQFTRGPGGWMYLAQGLSTQSNVRRPDGSAFVDGTKSKVYDRCRMARMKLDGSDFEYTTTGPNNIWGFVTGRDGEWFIQEANDKGYPVAAYDFGVYLNTGGTKKIKPYQPILPPIFKTAIMGGTGLSGLVLAEDRNSPFAREGKKVFYIANPLTSSIQVVTGTPTGNNRFKWEKSDDFMTSGDKWFRPVGMKFGPDGALYVVDWYNKIIAHGEVAQNHPDRDKVRGRIWRIRHKDQARVTPPNLAKASDVELLNFLRHDNALVLRQTWLEIIDRKAKALLPELKKLILDSNEGLDIRLAAFWAAEGLGGLDDALLAQAAEEQEVNLRAEVIRTAGRIAGDASFAQLAKTAANDPAVRVRNAVGEALVSRDQTDSGAMHAAALLGKAALADTDPLSTYEREFERFLARWAMENNPAATSKMLGQAGDLPTENRLLAMQSLKPSEAALAFLPMIPKLDRDLSTTELSLITDQLGQAKVRAGFEKLLNDPARQKNMLQALSKAEPSTTNKILTELLTEACRELIKRDNNPTNQLLVLQTAQRHRLSALDSDIGAWLLASNDSALITAGLRSLRELGPVDSKICLTLLKNSDKQVQENALIALSTSPGAKTIAQLAQHWTALSATGKQAAINGLINSKEKAEAFGKATLAGKFGELDGGSIEKIIITLAESPTAKELLKKLGDSIPMIIRLGNTKDSFIDRAINLKGPFTLEAWVRLSGKISANEILLSSNSGQLNFSKKRLTLSGKGRQGRNLVSAKTAASQGQWTHYALTRDRGGKVRIYLDGVLDATSKKRYLADFTGLKLGPLAKGAKARRDILEFRVWKSALSESSIREGLRITYQGEKNPSGLTLRLSGDSKDLPLKGNTRIVPASDSPELISATKAAELAAMFEKYQTIVKKPGELKNGALMFQQACIACHLVKGQGGKIGPDLSGAGAMGDLALLRNILTPNAALEASYYRHDLKLNDGSLLSGFMVSEDSKEMTMRFIGSDDRIISKSQIASHAISKRSLMPEGLISAMTDQQVADLFAYLRSLK